MAWDLAIVLGLLAVAIVLFALDRPRMDVVALTMMVLLPLTGVITVGEAFAGFADPAVILIAALFVIGEGITRTGIAYQVGQWLTVKAARSETRLLVLLMISVTLLGSIMSSTGIVAIFIPVVMSITSRLNIHPGRLMMPLSMAGLISGMMTLVATPPNMILDSALKGAGHEGFSFFAFTPIGLVVLGLGVAYMTVARNWLSTPPIDTEKRSRRRTIASFVNEYGLGDRAHRLRISAGSPLAGRLLEELDLRQGRGVNLVGIERRVGHRKELLNPVGQSQLMAGDVLLVDLFGEAAERAPFEKEMGLERLPLEGAYFSHQLRSVGMAEVVVAPESPLVGKTVVETAFRKAHGLSVIGLRRGGETLGENITGQKMRPGDILLVVGPWKGIDRLQSQKQDFVVLSIPAEIDDVAPALSQAPYALFSLAVMVALMVSGLVPNAIAALLACLLMGLFRCFDIETAYKSIRWQSVFLIVGMLPFAAALEKTGGVEMGVDLLMQTLGGAGLHVLVAALFLLTVLLGLFISNTATAVLMAPIALSLARQLDVSPYAFAMTIAIASSAAFITPMSSPVNTLVVGPGQYRFRDFVKVGVPFALLVLVVCTVLIPWWYG